MNKDYLIKQVNDLTEKDVYKSNLVSIFVQRMRMNGRWSLNFIDFSTRQATCVLFYTAQLKIDEA